MSQYKVEIKYENKLCLKLSSEASLTNDKLKKSYRPKAAYLST